MASQLEPLAGLKHGCKFWFRYRAEGEGQLPMRLARCGCWWCLLRGCPSRTNISTPTFEQPTLGGRAGIPAGTAPSWWDGFSHCSCCRRSPSCCSRSRILSCDSGSVAAGISFCSACQPPSVGLGLWWQCFLPGRLAFALPSWRLPL